MLKMIMKSLLYVNIFYLNLLNDRGRADKLRRISVKRIVGDLRRWLGIAFASPWVWARETAMQRQNATFTTEVTIQICRCRISMLAIRTNQTAFRNQILSCNEASIFLKY